MLFENFNILIALFQSVVTGYFTYFLIKSNDILVFSSAKKEEKLAMVSFLSLINWSIYWLIEKIIISKFPHMNFEATTLISFLCTFLIVLFLGLLILPRIISYLFGIINNRREKDGKLRFTRKPLRDSAFDHEHPQYLYIFGFDGSYIASGYLNIYQYNTDEYNELLLYAPKKPEERKTIEKVEELYKNNDVNIFLDYEKKVKIYIVPMDEAEDEKDEG